MNTREQFGNYLLLKKLGEDSLGETFRAGRVGRQGMEEVVLLRVFNGPAVQGTEFWQKVASHQEVHTALSSPNIATGVDLGQVNNVPYVVYDYISGKNLANLQQQASERRNPIPADHALLIAERVALGLAVGYETRLQDQRILHGAVVPQLIMISNEGETRILGFAVAPGVRDAAKSRPEMARYLSPEARAGQSSHKADDVYSLGVILLELLAGRPAPADGDPAALLAGATLQPEGSPLPDELKRLIQQSLAPRDQRIGDVLTWHKSLSKLMFEGQYNPTTFNLAFFMHNLFREEIEKESQEIEVERTMEIPVPSPSPPPAPTPASPSTGEPAATAASDLREATGVREDTGVIRDKYGIDEEAARGKKRNLLLGAAAALLVTIGVVGWFVFGRSPAEEAPPAETATAEMPPEPAPPTAEEIAAAEDAKAKAADEEAALREEEIQAQIQALLDKRLQETEKAYDQEIESLRAELEAERRRAEQAQRDAAATAAPAPASKARETATPSTETAAKAPATTPEPTAAPAKEQTAAPSTDKAKAAPVPSDPLPPATGPTTAPTTSQTTKRPAAPPEPSAPEPKAKRGDLVTMGPGVTPPRLVSSRTPRYPTVAQRLRKEATIVVKILVDEEGRVIETDLAGKEVGYGMDREAEEVAASSRWRPATKDGVPVKIWWQMPIKFAL